MTIHIGKKIKEELYKQGISVSAFAKKINRSRNVVYDIFKRESVDTELLKKIGDVLHIDFFSLYSEQKENKKEVALSILEDGNQAYKTIAEQLKAKEQEITYMQKIIDLLEEKIRKMEAANKKK